MQLNLFFALVGGLWFWFAASLAGYSWIQTLKSPIVVGTVLGALTGNLETGLITGGSIEMVYLGMVAAGGNIPSDRVFAALIAVPIAIQTGVTPEVAVSIAVPLGVLGVFVNNLRRTVNAVFVHWADKAADEADVKKVWRCATTYPFILGFIIRFPLMFVINYFGADFVTAMLNVMPAWLLTGFNVMGGMLPALGFATTIFMIGKMKYLPLFIIGFFLVKYLQIPTMAAAIFGICMALLIMFMGDEKAFDGLNFVKDLDGEKKEQERLLSEKDVNGVFLRWIWTAELSNSFERMQALAVASSFAPVLRKLYPNDEDLEAAIKRHLGFFNTQANWGCLIHGTVLAMEEQKAMGSDIPDEMITGIKTGLMGPLAGIGDTLDFGTIQTILFALGASFATTGNVVGVVFPIAFAAITFCEARFLFGLGYKLGKESIQKILSGGIINKIIDCASIVGMFMMGALSASIVKVSTPLAWTFGDKTVQLQTTLDAIAPGLLPLAAVFFVFWGIKFKKWTITRCLIILICASIIGAFLGVFAL